MYPRAFSPLARLANFLWPAVTATLMVAPGTAMAIEEPGYTVVQQFAGIELRDYAPYVVAEVQVSSSADKAGNAAFPILAGYIFGKNKGARRFEMTAPVTQTAEPMRMPMTAPVTQTAASDGYLVQFVLPKSVTLDAAPEPLDARVKLREVPGSRIAVIRYSGLWSEANQAEHLGKLQTALRTAGLAWRGEPTLSRYNAPITPWFMRRNEIWLTLQEQGRMGPASTPAATSTPTPTPTPGG